MNIDEECIIARLRAAGCKCPDPLIGIRPEHYRCRLCNTEEFLTSEIKEILDKLIYFVLYGDIAEASLEELEKYLGTDLNLNTPYDDNNGGVEELTRLEIAASLLQMLKKNKIPKIGE